MFYALYIKRFGLKQTIADTAGIGGIFRGLRTIPFMLDLVRDMRDVCPDALLMNYTNPMAILTWAVYRAYPEQAVVGLCHNIQNTANEIADYLKVPVERLSYHCAGINHMNWFLRLEIDREDAYLSRAAADLRRRGPVVPDDLLRHVSPQTWEHITLTGTYSWLGEQFPPDTFRPLRDLVALGAAA